MASYSFHVAFYATGLRGDDMEAALQQLAPIASRYGASHWAVYRSGDDQYRFLLIVDFPEKQAFQHFWYGDEAQEFRIEMSGKYQNPVVYAPHEVTVEGSAVVTKA